MSFPPTSQHRTSCPSLSLSAPSRKRRLPSHSPSHPLPPLGRPHRSSPCTPKLCALNTHRRRWHRPPRLTHLALRTRPAPPRARTRLVAGLSPCYLFFSYSERSSSFLRRALVERTSRSS